jgi:hypothetical protein
MDQSSFIPQMIKFNQTLFNNAFQATVKLQDQVEKMGNTMIGQLDWLPGESRKIYDDCIDAYKTSRSNFKSYVDEGYQQSEKLFK